MRRGRAGTAVQAHTAIASIFSRTPQSGQYRHCEMSRHCVTVRSSSCASSRPTSTVQPQSGAFVAYRLKRPCYFTTVMTRVMLMAVKPGNAGENSRSVKVPFFAPGFSTAFTCALSPS